MSQNQLDDSIMEKSFMTAIGPATTPERNQKIDLQLVEYCKLDSLAMAQIYHLFIGLDHVRHLC